MAATEGVHRGDQLEARGVDDVVIGQRPGDSADFQGLAQGFQDRG
jgi:hypothetical protein